MQSKDIEQFDSLTFQCFRSQNTQTRKEAEEKLESLSNSIEFISISLTILQETTSKYSQIYISNKITNLLTDYWENFQNLQINNVFEILVKILTEKNLEIEAEKSIIKTIARIIKLNWDLKSNSSLFAKKIHQICFQYSKPQISKLSIIQLHLIGFKIYIEMIFQFSNIISQKEPFILYKLRSISFRDHELISLLQRSLTYLSLYKPKIQNQDDPRFQNPLLFGNTVRSDVNPYIDFDFSKLPNSEQEQRAFKLRIVCIELAFACFSFDFSTPSYFDQNNINTKKNSENYIPFPDSWKYLFEKEEMIRLLFDYYFIYPIQLGSKILEMLYLFASSKSTLFSNSEKRDIFFEEIIFGVSGVLESKKGIENIDNFHQLSRLLVKIAVSYTSISTLEIFPKFFNLVSEFILATLQYCNQNINSYIDDYQNGTDNLIEFWIEICMSIFSVNPRLVDDSIQPDFNKDGFMQTIQTIFESYLNLIVIAVYHQFESGNLSGDESWILDSMLIVKIQLASKLAGSNPSGCFNSLISLYNSTCEKFNNFISNPNDKNNFSSNSQDIQMENSLTFSDPSFQIALLDLVITYSLLDSVFVIMNKERKAIIAKLSSSIINFHISLDQLTNSQQSLSNSFAWIELSFLHFLQKVNFDYIHFSDSMITMQETEIENEKDQKYQIIIEKIIKNLVFWNQSRRIISESLSLLKKIFSSNSFTYLPSKPQILETLVSSLANNSFTFLYSYQNSRFRKSFIRIISSSLFINNEINNLQDSIKNLISHFETQFNHLNQIINSLNPNNIDSNIDLDLPFIGFANDLRGLLSSLNSKKFFSMFFEWFYPKYSNILNNATNLLFQNPNSFNTLLQFWDELSNNRFGRITFDRFSFTNITIFKQVGKIISSYFQHLQKQEPYKIGVPVCELQPEDIDKIRTQFKTISICHSILSHCLSFGFVQFGAFIYYQDELPKNLIIFGILMMNYIDPQFWKIFPKFTYKFYEFVETITSIHLETIVELDTNNFVEFIEKIKNGLESEDKVISPKCCSSLDSILSYIILNSENQKNLSKINTLELFNQHFNSKPEIIHQFFQIIIEKLIYGDYYFHWFLSRPLFCLILANEQFFNDFKKNYISNLNENEQEKITVIFNDLFKGVEKNLEPKNRDQFSKNVLSFIESIKKLGKI
ncbi:exportin 7 [Anaeramoeba ignava]|uniref:Exportin 7 n=1 Tax=Anaeramoeba ignava TaxID=1746090 RepID=A0A9Q0LU79_ANAIG|nr:exportin 7 [Anaeramoeba ignava]